MAYDPTLPANSSLKAVLGVGVALVLAGTAWSSFRDVSFHAKNFDSACWKDGNARVRGEMVESLRSRSLLMKKTTVETFALLGKPEHDEAGYMEYRVDVGRRIAWRPFLVSLLVRFDEEGKVYRVDTID